MTKHIAASLTDGFYAWRPPNRAAASVTVQSRWGNLYDAPAAIRSLAVDVYRHACVFANIAATVTGEGGYQLGSRAGDFD